MKKILKEEFFIRNNSVEFVSQNDYDKALLAVESAEAFARTTNQCVYIIDYFRKEFLFCSNSMEYLCGLTKEEIESLGYDFYLNNVPEDEIEMLLEINMKGFELFDTFPVEERKNYTISYDFHINKGNKKTLINHKLTPLYLTQTGKIWLALCTMSYSARKSPGYITIKNFQSPIYYEYIGHKWVKKKQKPLTDNERAVLLLSAQGFTMNEISEKICRSVDSVKAYKRILFEKFGVTTIAEAISYATNYLLI